MQKADLGSTGIIQVKVAICVLQGDTPEGDLHSEGQGFKGVLGPHVFHQVSHRQRQSPALFIATPAGQQAQVRCSGLKAGWRDLE